MLSFWCNNNALAYSCLAGTSNCMYTEYKRNVWPRCLSRFSNWCRKCRATANLRKILSVTFQVLRSLKMWWEATNASSVKILMHFYRSFGLIKELGEVIVIIHFEVIVLDKSNQCRPNLKCFGIKYYICDSIFSITFALGLWKNCPFVTLLFYLWFFPNHLLSEKNSRSRWHGKILELSLNKLFVKWNAKLKFC